MKIVTSQVDETSLESEFSKPGLGCFGERYFHMETDINEIPFYNHDLNSSFAATTD